MEGACLGANLTLPDALPSKRSAMVESVSPPACISLVQNTCLAGGHDGVRAKAAAVVAAAAWCLAATELSAFDQARTASLLRIAEALCSCGAASRQAALKLAVVCNAAFVQRQLAGGAAPVQGARDGEDAWVAVLRLSVEPATAAALGGAVSEYGAASRELLADEVLGKVVGRLVLAA